jgi:hypothetical protein
MITTVVAAVAQIAGLFLLIMIHQFTLVNLAILRAVTELLMCVMRIGCAYRFRDQFQ